jgi:protein TonB
MRIQSLAALAMTVAAMPAAAAEPVEPKPIENPGAWIGSDDYPPAAMRADVEGVVRFVLGITADGNVTDCTVQESSGDAGLDTLTCDLLRARAKFSPAQDDDGNATAGTWRSSVRWQIPDVAHTLPPVLTVSYRFVVEKDGSVSSCEVLSDTEEVSTDAGGPGGPAAQACAQSPGQSFEPITGKDGAPVRSVTTVTFKIERTVLFN